MDYLNKKSENFDIFVLARMGSSRLPGKHLKKIDDKPIIIGLINRLKKSKKFRKIIVCTTKTEGDDILVKCLKKEKIDVFRGSEKDILDRLLNAAKFFETNVIIDVEGDKIFMDPEYIDKVIEEMNDSKIDFVEGEFSNQKKEAIHGIHGFIPAGIRVDFLQKICKLKKVKNTETGYREFFNRFQQINKKYLKLDTNLKIPINARFTLDYPEDLEFAKRIFLQLGTSFNTKDVINFINKNPQLLEITEPVLDKWNEHYKQNITDYSLNEKT